LFQKGFFFVKLFLFQMVFLLGKPSLYPLKNYFFKV